MDKTIRFKKRKRRGIMKRWMISLGLFAAVLTFLPTSGLAYSDVSEDRWYYDEVTELSEKNIITGFPNGEFRPDSNISRQDTAVMIFRALGLDEDAEVTAPFEDLNKNSYAHQAVASLYEAGVIKGTSETTFEGSRDITRGELAVLIKRAFELSASDSAPSFADTENHVYSDEIQSLADAGIAMGSNDGNYYPDNQSTRAETAAFLNRIIKGGDEGSSPEDDENEEGFSLTSDEQELAQNINAYREEQGLAPLSVSVSLTETARAHVEDSNAYSPEKVSTDCNLHSWSDNGNWTPVCYGASDDDGVKTRMKPSEITDGVYTGDGFENSYWHKEEATVEKAMNGWKNSESHNALMTGQNSWSTITTMGVAIEGNYAHVWYGREDDPQGYAE
jgi:uncharacterized protein YkwD